MTHVSEKTDILQQATEAVLTFSFQDKQDALLGMALHLLHRATLQGNLDYVLQDFSNLIEREGKQLLGQFDKRVEDDSVVAY